MIQTISDSDGFVSRDSKWKSLVTRINALVHWFLVERPDQIIRSQGFRPALDSLDEIVGSIF